MTPTSGGSTTGRATSPPKSRRPGNSYRVNRKASGTPSSADNTTVTAEIQIDPQSACHSLGCWKNRCR